jgi:hypothetical protein
MEAKSCVLHCNETVLTSFKWLANQRAGAIARNAGTSVEQRGIARNRRADESATLTTAATAAT